MLEICLLHTEPHGHLLNVMQQGHRYLSILTVANELKSYFINKS